MKALQAGGALPGDAFFRHALAPISGSRYQDAPPLQGGFLASLCIPSPVSGIRMPNLPLLPVWEKGVGGMRGQTRPTSPFAPCGRRGRGDAHRGRCFGKPLRAISRFRHQDAQPPPSPRVGEGGRGDEGANTPNLPLRPVWEKGGGGMLTEVDVLASPCVPSPVSGIRTPNLPLLPV
jgi:hypothetical protein